MTTTRVGIVVGALALTVLGAASEARAETYRVGPGQPIRELSELPALDPGDVVEVLGGAEYAGGVVIEDAGTEAAPITIRGVPDGSGARPILRGGVNTIEVRGDHVVIEQLDITGGSFRCFFHHSHDVVMRDTVVHDCPRHGILGADQDSGSLTLERVEVHHCGGGTQDHQIYMATDEEAHPGSVFRMQQCWVHDGNGGNGVKSRAERNEIYFNWIEGSYYHELELIGPDGADESLAREDSDVVGNVLVKSGANETFAVVRFGGDGTGQTFGRYRFVGNTVVLAPGDTSAVFRLFDGIESVEMHDNVFVRRGGGGIRMVRDVEADWVSGTRRIAGSHNWAPTGSELPAEWTDTITGGDPGLVDVAALELAPASMSSAVVDAGVLPTPTFAASPFPRPLQTLDWQPRRGVGGTPRPSVGTIDVGAYEHGSGPLPVDGGVADAGGSDADGGVPPQDGGASGIDAGASDGGSIARDAGGPSGGDVDGGCGCRAGTRSSTRGAWAALLVLAMVIVRRRAA